jgi:hypothetical protein
MRVLKVAVLSVVLTISAIAQKTASSAVTVTELPPEPIPVGTCTQSPPSGYLGIVEKNRKERTTLTAEEVGNYVKKSLAQGYSVTLYPQASGKIFTTATCYSSKP